jgi:hypothetical protein
MALEFITKALREETTPTQKLILIILANYSDEFGESYPSHKTMMKLTGLSLTAIKSNLNKLRDQGKLEWKQRNNSSNLYHLTLGGALGVYGGSASGYNTKANTKKILILPLEKIHEIYLKHCDRVFFIHDRNCFSANESYKKLKEATRKDVFSPRTGAKLDLNTEEFWIAYFKVANSDGHKKWIRSFWDKKPRLQTMLNIKQFNTIIERRYG